MSDSERNMRVTYKLPREAAIRLREIALTRSELLNNLGVLAVQLGNESQICISSSLNFDTAGQNAARKGKTIGERSRKRDVETTSVLRESSKATKVDNNIKELSNVDRGVRAVGQDRSCATASSVTISDSLPSMNTVNKASFMNRASVQENGRTAHKIHAKPSPNTSDITRRLCTSLPKGDGIENHLPVKPISHNGVIQFKAKDVPPPQDAECFRSAMYANKGSSKTSLKDTTCNRNDTQDTITLNMDSVSANTSKATAKGKDTDTSQETDVVQKIPSKVPGQDSPRISHELDTNRQTDRTESKTDSKTTSIKVNEPEMTDAFDCNVNNDINSNVPTFPGHGISFAQHLINLSKQYRLENEKSPSGLSSEKYFASDASGIVRNDHVLRSFTAANEKQEDFLGFSGQNALLFDGNYSTTAVKSAEELSKEQSEASPTNMDSMSEASADSLFEEARLGSVDELSLSPSSNENAPVSSEENSVSTSPAPTANIKSDNQGLQVKQEKHKRKKYQRHLKGHSGIVCKLCRHAVQKSYSCYKLSHAPKEIQHLFDDGSHCVRVCRRCLPYKSPKSSEKNTQKKLHKTIEKLFK